jgi:hypothetical protein
MPDNRRDPDDVLDLDDEPTPEELETQVQKAQAELTDLKRRAEQIERDKQRLEELSRRQDELETGRAEMIDKLTRSMATIQRETEDAQRRLDLLEGIHDAFIKHLRTLESINPKTWVGGDLSKELSKGLSCVDDARAEYQKSVPKFAIEPSDEAGHPGPHEYDEYYGGGEKGFLYWLTAGFAFTLPIQILAVIGILVWLWSLTSPQ